MDGDDRQRAHAERDERQPGEEPADQRERERLHRQASRRAPAEIAVRMPCMSATGVGGQPGTATSTGMTLATRPQLAYDSPNTPPVQPQSPTATTSLGSGV